MPKTGVDVGRFLCAFEDWLTADLMARTRPERVVFETAWVGPKTNQATARKLMGMAGEVEKICHRNGLMCVEANNASVRKHFIGKGRGTRDELKQMTIEACRARGWQPANDDEADALAILDYALRLWRIDVPWADGPLIAVSS